MSTGGVARELIEEQAFFRGMSSKDIQRLASVAELVSVPASTVLVRAGERSAFTWLLQAGAVTVDDETSAVRPGGAFGVGPVLDEPEVATLATTREANLLRWTKAAGRPR